MKSKEEVKIEKSLDRRVNIWACLTGFFVLAAVAGGAVCYATDALNQSASYTMLQDVGMRMLATGVACGAGSMVGLAMAQISAATHIMRKIRQDKQRS